MSAAIEPTERTSVALRRRARAVARWRPVVFAVTAMIGYLLSVVAANVASVHWPPLVVGGLLVPAGTVFAGMSLTARDLVHDKLGARGVVAGIAAGAGLSAVLASPQIAVASVAAFTASEIVDALVYTRLRRRTRVGAVAVSNAVGLVVDSALFVPLAFGNFTAVPGQIVGKSIATLLAVTALDHLGCTEHGYIMPTDAGGANLKSCKREGVTVASTSPSFSDLVSRE